MAVEQLFDRPVNVTTPQEFFLQYPNDQLVGGTLGYTIMGIIFVVSFGAMVQWNVDRAFPAAAFLTFVATAILVPIGIVDTYGWAVAGILLALGTVLAGRRGGGL